MRVIIFVVFFALVGCVGSGPHLSIERESESPVGTPTGETDDRFPAVPPLTGNQQMSGSGAVVSRSESYTGYGGTAFVFGGRSAGGRYRMVATELSLGRRVMRRGEQ